MHLYNKNALTLERKFLQIIVLETLIVIQTRAMDAKKRKYLSNLIVDSHVNNGKDDYAHNITT